MKRSRLLLWIGLLAVILSGCVGARLGVSWPATDTLVLNGEESIVISFTEHIGLVDPANGANVRLLNADGEVRRDEDGNTRIWVLDGNQYEGAQFFAKPLLVDDDTVRFPVYNNRLLEVDLPTAIVDDVSTFRDASAEPLAGHSVTNILETDDFFYIGLEVKDLIAIDKESLQEVWRVETANGVWATPLLVDDVLYFGSLDHFLYAVNAENGRIIWQTDLEGGIAVAPLHIDGRLYVGSFAHKVFEISASDGSINAEYQTNNWVWNTPVIDEEGILYTADLDGYVFALDTANNLSEVWAVHTAERGIRPSPVLISENRLVVAGREGVVYWLDARDGSTIFSQEIEGRPEILSEILYLEPSDTLEISEPLLIVSTMDRGKLMVAFRINGGAAWTYSR